MIVTISRQMGSMGRAVGEQVATHLGYVLMDREILQRAAAAVEVSEEALSDADEKKPSILDRVSAFIIGYQPPIVPEYVPADVVFIQQVPTTTTGDWSKASSRISRRAATPW